MRILPIWLVFAGTLLTAPSLQAADLGPYGYAPPRPEGYGPRRHHHARFDGAVSYGREPQATYDDPTDGFAQALDLQPSPPAPEFAARRELALPVGVIYNVPADPFLPRRRYEPVIRANY